VILQLRYLLLLLLLLLLQPVASFPQSMQQQQLQHGIIADGNAPDAGYHGFLPRFVVFARLWLGRWLPPKRNRTESGFNLAKKTWSILTHWRPRKVVGSSNCNSIWRSGKIYNKYLF